MELFDIYMSDAARDCFWSKIDKRGEDECWPWKAYVDPQGYGHFFVRKVAGKNACMRATRVMIWLEEGPFPAELVVRHSCDNPPCVNPAHLKLGTHADNVRDKVERQRQPRGEGHWNAYMSEAAALEIRRRVAAGERRKSIATDLQLPYTTVCAIARGETWKHTPNAVAPTSRPHPLDPALVAEARRRVKAEEAIQAVAADLGVKYTSLVHAVRGDRKKWADPVEGEPPVPAKPKR